MREVNDLYAFNEGSNVKELLANKKWRISKNSVLCLFFYIAIKIIIDYSYVYVISPRFSYAGLTTTIDWGKMFEGYIAVLWIGACFPKSIKKVSDFLLFFFFVSLFLPLASIYGLKDESRLYFYALSLSFLLMNKSRILAHFIPIPSMRLRSRRRYFIYFAVFAMLGMFAWIIANDGLSLFNLNIWRVYEFRRITAALLFSGIFAYFMPLLGKVIMPSILAVFLWKKATWQVVSVLFLQIIYFGFTHHKSVLFYPVVILALAFFLQKKQVIRSSLYCIILLLLIMLVHYVLTDSLSLVSLFIRRVLFVTANIHYAYFNFFNSAGPIFMSNSLLSSYFEYPFIVPPPQIISFFQYGHYDTWVNGGFLATGYMHFGYLGMLFFSVISGMILGCIDRLQKRGLPLWFAVSLVFIPFTSLRSADLTTTLNTHGLFLAIVVLWLFSNNFYSHKALKY